MHQDIDTSEHPRRRKYDADNCAQDCTEVQAMHGQLSAGRRRMDALEEGFAEMQHDVAEVLEILRMGKSFFKVVGYFGTFVKWVTAVGAPIVAIYFAVKGGGK